MMLSDAANFRFKSYQISSDGCLLQSNEHIG
jgi:hypothetical protein